MTKKIGVPDVIKQVEGYNICVYVNSMEFSGTKSARTVKFDSEVRISAVSDLERYNVIFSARVYEDSTIKPEPPTIRLNVSLKYLLETSVEIYKLLAPVWEQITTELVTDEVMEISEKMVSS